LLCQNVFLKPFKTEASTLNVTICHKRQPNIRKVSSPKTVTKPRSEWLGFNSRQEQGIYPSHPFNACS